jgi:hypothetical protein
VTAEVASIECVAAKGNAPVAGTPRQSKRNCVRWIKRWSCYYFLHETSDEITTEAPNFACQLVGITSNFGCCLAKFGWIDYGSLWPIRFPTKEASLPLMRPSTVTSARKFVELAFWPDLELMYF